jgi:small nuclear ribonucleoprotein D3
MSIGVPIKLLHEAENHVITVELKNGEVYRGYLVDAEDTMNCRMETVTVTSRDGKVTVLEQVYLRGAQIRFIIVPDMLKNAPMFKRIKQTATGKGVAITRGRGLRGKAGLLTATQRGRPTPMPLKDELRY